MTIIVVKVIFQFEFWPWINVKIYSSQPLNPVRIWGIERRKHYVTVDILTLLALFLHRAVLKSLGLWNSDESSPNDQCDSIS